MSFTDWIVNQASKYLLKEGYNPNYREYLCDFNRVSEKIQQCDVLLIEGQNRVSSIIRHITQSVWTHAVLYIGHLHEIEDEALAEHIRKNCDCDANSQLMIETEIGKGTSISTLDKYRKYHLRLLRPKGLTKKDSQL